MSIARQILRDFGPFFRMLGEPISRPGFPYLGSSFNGPFGLMRSSLLEPFSAVDVTDQGDKYVLEADLPGVRKDNIQVRIGDNGRSVTIEGKVVGKRGEAGVPNQSEPTSATAQAEAAGVTNDTNTAVTHAEGENQISSERTFVHNATFRRTVWLPQLVDQSRVKAQLDHGVLTIEIPKGEDNGSVVVPIQ